MQKKVLIAYATYYGSTAEVAQAVAERIRALGAEVDVHPVKEVRDLSPYQAVMLGSAIRGGKIHPAAQKFLERNEDALSKLPVAYFVCCMTAREKSEDTRLKVESYLVETLNRTPKIKPISTGFFAGKLEYSKLEWLARLMLKALNAPEGDFRNWQEIRDWAEKTYAELK
jgi:menaquinone-dependent protoporphyrinogen oxidase